MSQFTDEIQVQGSVDVNNFPAVQPVSGTVTATGPLTDTQLRATPVPVTGSFTSSASTATVSQVVLTANTSTTLLVANANRVKVILFAPSMPVYVKFGTTASVTSFTYKLTANNSTLEISGYTGRIDIMATSGQTVTVTETVI